MVSLSKSLSVFDFSKWAWLSSTKTGMWTSFKAIHFFGSSAQNLVAPCELDFVCLLGNIVDQR